MRWIVALLTVAAALLGRAEAQPAPWQPERLTPGWVFTPTVMLGGMWDSNVTVRNQGNPLVQEWVGTINPRGELVYNGRRLQFNVGYSGALETYSNVSELNRYEQKGRVSARYRATPRLQATTGVSYTASPTTDRLEIGTLPFVDFGGRMFDLTNSVIYDATARTQFVGAYGFQDITFDRDRTAGRNTVLLGGYAHTPAFRVSHSLTSRIAVGGDWEYRRATVGVGTQRFDVQTVLGGVTYRLSEAISVSGGAGASYLAIDSTDISMWGPAFRAGLEYQVQRTTLSAKYTKQFVPSFSFGGLTANQGITVAGHTPLTRRLQFDASIAYSKADPVADLGVGYGLDSWWTNWSLGYLLAPWLRGEGFLSTMFQTSTARGNFDRTRVGIQFVTFKPVRIQ
jgi:hypothetical protein